MAAIENNPRPSSARSQAWGEEITEEDVSLDHSLKVRPEVREVDLLIYHKNCADGTCGAWPIWRENQRRYRNNEIVIEGWFHGQEPPEKVDGKTIVIVDFCFSLEIIVKMAARAKSILILDHHVSSARSLGFVNGDTIASNLPSNVTAIFDFELSGAQIAWDWVYPGQRRPWFIKVVADRDLYQFRTSYSKLVSSAFISGKYYRWESLNELYSNTQTLEAIKAKVKKLCQDAYPDAMEREKEVTKLCSNVSLTRFISTNGDSYTVKVVSDCPRFLRSDVGNRLAEQGCDFAAMIQYDFLLNEWWISCRAKQSSPIDLPTVLSEFARAGGHPHACGFTISAFAGDHPHNYFRILEIPRDRAKDAKLVAAAKSKWAVESVIPNPK